MAFISKNILLDLPFYEIMDGPGRQWEDKGINGYHATANETCESGTLENLGSCLWIKQGGVLTFPAQAANLIAGEEKCFTVEFWAEPEDPKSTERRQILSGPVNVWKEQDKIFWSVVGDPSETCYAVEGAAGLHHWAIVAKTADDPPRHVFRDGIEVRIETRKASSAGATGLVIGAVKNGWTGKLAHLRMWSAALDAVQLKKNMARDITAHAAFKASTGIEWRLLNSDEEPSLYIQGGRKQELSLVVENRSGKNLIIPRRTNTELSREKWHFNLVFRPGTLAKCKLDDDLLERITQANSGWRVMHDKWEQQDRLHFLWTGPSDKAAETIDHDILAKTIDKTLASGESLTIVLPDVAAEPGSGSRTTRVLLKYNGLKLGEDSTTSLDGHRSQLLNIIYRDPLVPYRRPPLEVGVVGAPVILNNGDETSLTLYIKNLNRDANGNATSIVLGPANAPIDKKPKFILEIDSMTEAVETPGDKLNVGDKYSLNGKAYEVLSKTDTSCQVRNLKTEEKTSPSVPEDVLVFGKSSIDAKGLGDVDDLLGMTPTIVDNAANLPIDIKGGTAIGSVVRWEMPVKRTVARIVARLADLVGLYQRLPVENEWHEGRIQLDGENLKWTNNAGVSWRLIPDLQNNVLKTDASNPYDKTGPRNFIIGEKAKKDGFYFGVSGEFYQRDVQAKANLGLEKNETVFLTLADLKTAAPPGRSVLRLRYEDFDEYGEGVFEIPVDRVPAVPAKLKQGGAGYGLALGLDPRVGQTDPNAEVLNEVLSVKKQKGDGDAVRIENNGGGSGLSVVQNGTGPAAKFMGGSGVEIESALKVTGNASISGNVGIGTTSPNTTLSVVGSGFSLNDIERGFWTLSANVGKTAGRGADAHSAFFYDTDSKGSSLGNYWRGVLVGDTGDAGFVQAGNQKKDGVWTNRNLVFQHEGGNVGIGTTDLGENKLKVAGDTEIVGNLVVVDALKIGNTVIGSKELDFLLAKIEASITFIFTYTMDSSFTEGDPSKLTTVNKVVRIDTDSVTFPFQYVLQQPRKKGLHTAIGFNVFMVGSKYMFQNFYWADELPPKGPLQTKDIWRIAGKAEQFDKDRSTTSTAQYPAPYAYAKSVCTTQTNGKPLPGPARILT